MSYYSTIQGHINVRTKKGAQILQRLFESWTEEENARYGSLVDLTDKRLEFDGYYRNAGRVIEPCLRELAAIGELANVDIVESTTDGFTATYHYFMDRGNPRVQVDDRTHDVHETRPLDYA